MTHEELTAYFKRIDFHGETLPTLATLTTLQELHVRHFPFEDLNPLLHLPVKIDPATLFRKLVADHRGGYCFEQNGLFKEVLKTLGFQVTGLLGRVVHASTEIARKTHECLHITLDGKIYHVDVGFGGVVPPTPLLFETGLEQNTSLEKFRIIPDQMQDFALQIFRENAWKTLYIFDLRPQEREHYEVANWFTSTHPDSIFTNHLMLSIVGHGCRYGLYDNRLSIHYPNQPSERKILETPTEIRTTLEQIFNLKLHNLPGLDEKLRILIDQSPTD